MNVFLCRITHDGPLHPQLQLIEDALCEAITVANDVAVAGVPMPVRHMADRTIGKLYDMVRAIDDTRKLPPHESPRYAVLASLDRKLCGKNEEPVNGYETYGRMTIVEKDHDLFWLLASNGTFVYAATTLRAVRDLADRMEDGDELSVKPA